MRVVEICSHLQKNINNKNSFGIVHSVFNSVFNVTTTDNQFITLINSSKPMAPNAIKLSENVSFLEMGIEARMKMFFYNEYAILEDKLLKFEYDKALGWDKSPVLRYSKSNKENVITKIGIMKDFLATQGKAEGILAVLTFLNESFQGFELLEANSLKLGKKEDFIKERFLSFMEAYLAEEYKVIADKVEDVIGFGVGLTPSMDDFICGLMVARVYLLNYMGKSIFEALEFNEQMLMKISGKTTRVSEEMLKFSSKGEVNENIRSLMISLTSDIPIDEFIYNLKTVASYGETSGIDIISGIYIGSKILLNQYSRG